MENMLYYAGVIGGSVILLIILGLIIARIVDTIPNWWKNRQARIRIEKHRRSEVYFAIRVPNKYSNYTIIAYMYGRNTGSIPIITIHDRVFFNKLPPETLIFDVKGEKFEKIETVGDIRTMYNNYTRSISQRGYKEQDNV